MTAIDRIQEHVSKIHPGLPFTISAAAQPGHGVAQGDLHLILIDKVPKGYKPVFNPSPQLVPGNTEGSRHCLDSLDGVTLYRKDDWETVAEETFYGPVLVFTQERTVLHPKHGDVTIPAGTTILCTYQPEFDAMQRKARRNAD